MRMQQATRALLVKRAQLVGLLVLGCVSLAMAADKAAELSDEFLEYLGSLEGNEDSWQDFAAAAVADHKLPATSSSSSSATSKATAIVDKVDK
jgi:hypothetical protein